MCVLAVGGVCPKVMGVVKGTGDPGTNPALLSGAPHHLCIQVWWGLVQQLQREAVGGEEVLLVLTPHLPLQPVEAGGAAERSPHLWC